MKQILQNNPNTFQTSDMKTLTHLHGFFWISRLFEEDEKCKQLKAYLDEDSVSIGGDYHRYRLEIIPKHIGGGLWLSSIAMLLNIERLRHIFTGKTVIELGAGLGIPCMHAAHYAKSVTLSDVDIDVTLISASVNDFYGNVTARYINWDDMNEQHLERYDIVVACDCIYRTTKKPFLNVVQQLLNSGGCFLMCNAIREGLDEFIYAMEEQYRVTVEQQTLIYNDEYECELVFVVATMDTQNNM